MHVRYRSMCGAEAKHDLEGSHGCLTTFVAKDELVTIDLQLIAAYAVIGFDEPLL